MAPSEAAAARASHTAPAHAGRPLRVGLLTYGLDRPLSGTTRVALELGRALAQAPDLNLEVVYLTPYLRGPFREEGAMGRAWFLPACRLLPGLLALGGPLLALAARRLRLDVIHDPIGVSPFTLGRWAGGFARVVTLHDAIAFRFPEGYPWLNRVVHRRYVPATLRNVDAVLTDSNAARADLRCFLGVPAQRLHVAPLGVQRGFRPLPDAERRAVAARYGLRGPYILAVGARQARKNHARLIEAFARARAAQPGVQLAITGPRQWAGAELEARIAELGLGDAVADLGFVPDADLPALYGAAELFAFPSLYEGFGLPVLEAMACGTPVVCANTTALPEVAGNAALQVDPYDVGALAEAMERGMADGALRANLRARGLARAAAFTWERTARETARVYRTVTHGSRAFAMDAALHDGGEKV